MYLDSCLKYIGFEWTGSNTIAMGTNRYCLRLARGAKTVGQQYFPGTTEVPPKSCTTLDYVYCDPLLEMYQELRPKRGEAHRRRAVDSGGRHAFLWLSPLSTARLVNAHSFSIQHA